MVVHPDSPSVNRISPIRATQKLGKPVPNKYTSNRSASGKSRARTSSRRVPQIRIGSHDGPSYFVPCEMIRCSHGSRTSAGGRSGSNSNRMARGLVRGRCRFSTPGPNRRASRESDTRRIGSPIAPWICMKPRSHPAGRSIFSS